MKKHLEVFWPVYVVACLSCLIIWAGILHSKPDPLIEKLNIIENQLIELQESNNRLEDALHNLAPKPVALLDSLPAVHGRASVYSEAGCLGCDSERIMANGEKLDDTKKTLALACRWENGHCYLRYNLGTKVTVRNTTTGRETEATVTDTFNGIYGRIADLSSATAKEIHCTGLCSITIK